jgi:hypothetical protein
MGNIPEIDFTKIDSIPVLGETTPEEEVDNFLQGSPIPKLEVDSKPEKIPEISLSKPISNIAEIEFKLDGLASGKDNESLVYLDSIFEEYGNKDMTKEMILADDRLVQVMRDALTARRSPGFGKALGRTLTYTLGGDVGGQKTGLRAIRGFTSYQDMPKEELFDTFTAYQRSLLGGNTVTTVNEVVYGMQVKDTPEAQKLKAGYDLFEQYPNLFTGVVGGDVGFKDFSDGIYTYGRDAVWDVSTPLSYGIGKLLAWGTSKVASLGVKSLFSGAMKSGKKAGVAKDTALRNIGRAMKNSMPYATADTALAVGVDVLYQNNRINLDVVDEYRYADTLLAALGGMTVYPILAGTGASIKEFRKSKYAPQWLSYTKFNEVAVKEGLEAAEKNLMKTVKEKVDFKFVDNLFGTISGSKQNFLAWQELLDKSKGLINRRKESYTDNEVTDSFFRYLFAGNPETGVKGYGQVLQENGMVNDLPALIRKYGNETAVQAQTLGWLSDNTVRKMVNKFETDTGLKLRFIDEEGNVVQGSKATAKSLQSHYAKMVSTGARNTQIVQTVHNAMSGGADIGDAIRGGVKVGDEVANPRRFRYTLSLYKRLMTSHLSTTGANVKGFAAVTSLNTITDFAMAAMELSQSGMYKVLRNSEKAEEYYNKSYGSFFGGLRRGFDVISPDIPMEYADKILALNPQAKSDLFRDIAGDGGIRDALADFDLDKITYKNGMFEGAEDVEKLAWKIIDSGTKGAQTVTLVRLQDELTKRFAFGVNMNQQIMRKYGMTSDEFFSSKNAQWSATEMATDKFQNDVIGTALKRTMRETASTNWSKYESQTNNWYRYLAKKIEETTNQTPIGYVFPFGSFLNTTLATFGDYSGINAVRYYQRKALGLELDPNTGQDLTEATAKALVGYSTVVAFMYGENGAYDKIESGLPPQGKQLPDGSIRDQTFDWPLSTFNTTAAIFARGLNGSMDIRDFDPSRVPVELVKELELQLYGQLFRDLDDAEKGIKEWAESIYNALVEEKDIPEAALNVLKPAMAQFVNGATRPLDPINQIYGVLSDANMKPDLRQGPETLNQMLKYVDALTGTSEDLPIRATPLRGNKYVPNISKQMLGAREMPFPELIEQMHNKAEVDHWAAIKWNGPAEVKNVMDTLAAPYFQAAAYEALQANPNYNDMNLEEQRKVLDTIKQTVRANVIQTMEVAVPAQLNFVRILSGKNKAKVKKVMKIMGVEGELEDILKKDDALNILQKIKLYVDNYDDIFLNEIKDF